jgi:hypothetical protein
MSDKLLQSHNTHHNLNLRRLEKSHHSPFYNIFCNSLWGYIKFSFFFGIPKWESQNYQIMSPTNLGAHKFFNSNLKTLKGNIITLK